MKTGIAKFIIYLSIVFFSLSVVLFGGCFLSESSADDSIDGESSNPDKTESDGDLKIDVVGNAYYFDSDAKDGGDGGEDAPFNNLSSVNSIDLEPGDAILFRAGSEFYGPLELKNVSGTEVAPILVGAYGNIVRDGRPSFDGNDCRDGGVVYIENCSFLTVENLEIYDSAEDEGDRRGVLINVTGESKNPTEVAVYTGITLDNLYVHDIRGITDAANSGMSTESKKTGGIVCWSDDGYGRTDGLTIKNCKIEDVDNVGIATFYKSSNYDKVSPYSDDFQEYAHSNLLISGNEICFIGKNGIFVRNLYGGVIEHNTLYETATTCVSGNTIVTSYVYGTVVQYNEGFFNRASARQSDGKFQDGCMLDADLQSRDTVWQFNYSHDNSFGLFMNCTSYDGGIADKVTVRYNLSVHDFGNGGIIYVNYVTAGIDFYNNTIVVSEETSPIILKSNGEDRNYNFYNNIIYNMSKGASIQVSDYSYADFSNNLVYNAGEASISGLDEFMTKNINGIYSDPMFSETYSDNEERSGMLFAEKFMLDSSSPAYGAAKELEYTGADYFGNKYKNCIGFCCA